MNIVENDRVSTILKQFTHLQYEKKLNIGFAI